MYEVKATWKGGFKFLGIDGGGRELRMDASVGAGGEGDGYRPSELPLLGLAGCTGIDTLEILQKMRQPVEGLDVRVVAAPNDGYPARYTRIEVQYTVLGKGLSMEKVERAVKLSEDKYCTVGQTLANGTEMIHTIKLVEEQVGSTGGVRSDL